MNGTVLSNKCPNCGGKKCYNPDTRKFHCENCGHEEPVSYGGTIISSLVGTALYDYQGVAGKKADEKAFRQYSNADWGRNEVTVECPGCGAQATFAPGKMTAKCEFCGTEVTQIKEKSDEMAPQGIIPFTVNLQGTDPVMRYQIFNNILVPKQFKQNVRIENLKPYYLPVWVFDAKANVEFSARYGDNEKWLRTDTAGQFQKVFQSVGAPASQRFRQAVESQIEEYLMTANVPFEPKYTAGYTVEKFTIPMDDAWKEVQNRLKRTLEDDICQQVCNKFGKKFCKVQQLNVNFAELKYRCILVPMWVDTVPFKGKEYVLAVNGQTGSFAGDYPAMFR